jgi:hypothetical protein
MPNPFERLQPASGREHVAWIVEAMAGSTASTWSSRTALRPTSGSIIGSTTASGGPSFVDAKTDAIDLCALRRVCWTREFDKATRAMRR